MLSDLLLELARANGMMGLFFLLAIYLTGKAVDIYHTRFKNVEKGYAKQEESIVKQENSIIELQKTINSLEENARCLPCNNHYQEISGIAADIKSLTRSVDEVRAFLAAKNPKSAGFFSGKHSPRTLNILGKQLYESAQGADFLKDNKDMLFAKMDERKPQTALDVEMYANEILLVCSMDAVFNDIKNFIYNSPDMDVLDEEGRTVKRSITISDVCFVMSLPFRDMYLESHPNLADTEGKKWKA